MGDYNIPIIEPAIDYTKVPPINQKRTIAFINHFISQTVSFLNKFALTCEEKLFEFENKLQKVEASLELLESRISSISGLNESAKVAEQVPEKTNETIKEAVAEKDKTENEETVQSVDEIDDKSVPVSTQNNEDATPENDMIPISSDPAYQKYFKMLHVGVPKAALKLKMQQEGLDPSVLDNPDKLVPKSDLEKLSS